MGTDILTVAELTTMGLAVRGEKGRVNSMTYNEWKIRLPLG